MFQSGPVNPKLEELLRNKRTFRFAVKYLSSRNPASWRLIRTFQEFAVSTINQASLFPEMKKEFIALVEEANFIDPVAEEMRRVLMARIRD